MIMKRLIVCLLVLIGAGAMNMVVACQLMRTPAQGEIVELQGKLEGIPEPCDDPTYETCSQCQIPVINVGGVIYIINEQAMTWSLYLANNHILYHDDVLATGVVSEDEKYHYIDLVTLNKVTQAVENISTPHVLDPHQPMFNTLGLPVDDSYTGIVIQNGHKFVK